MRQQKRNNDSTVEPQYDEVKYNEILENIKNSRLLNLVSFDHDQAELMMDRLKEDIFKICDAAQNN